MTNSPNSSHNAIDPFGRDADENVVPLRRRLTPQVEFLHRLRHGGPWMLVAIDPDNGRIEARTIGSGTEVNAFVAKWNGKRNLYYAVNPTRQWMNKKAEKEDVAEIEYLLSDFDPIGDESPEEAKQRYLKQLESFEPRPTMLMDSGNGLQGLWQLRLSLPLGKPITLDQPIKVKGKTITRQFSPEDQATIADIEARSAALMRRLGAPTGTQNVDRILRLPGTINLPNAAKKKKGRVPCQTKLLWFEWSKYSVEDFPQETPQEQQGGIPFMITQKMKATLRSAGYSDEQIADMTPTQAHEIIGQRKGNGHAQDPFEQAAEHNKVHEIDTSPSGFGWRFMRACRRKGMGYEQAREAILADDGEAGVWANRDDVDERQLVRAYERWDLYDEKKRKPTGEGWPEPKPLPHGLAPVMAFDTRLFLPDALAPWVDDIAARLQCPPDYVGVSAVTALGSVIGRRVGIKPQAKTDWIEYPNLWTAFIGQPGMLKSPAMLAALAPLHHLEAEAAKENQIAREAYEANLNTFKLRAQVKASLAKAALKNKGKETAFDLGEKPEEPVAIRFRTNDSTYESLGEILIGNPTGILIERDELVSLLQHLDREEQAVARGFYMSGWAGTQPYTFDRVIRGHLHIDAACLSILGNTQPVRINRYVRRANLEGGGDGLIQRFGLLVWPDISPEWDDVDQYPNSDARRRAWNVFEQMSTLDEGAVRKLGAHKGRFDKTPYFRFDEDAREEFVDWRQQLELRLRSGELSPALEGHFAKYRKLVPALALINHLADGGKVTVGRAALRKALAFSVYLESHAQRVYGAADMVELAAGEAILLHIKAGDLADGFTARDVHRHGWSNLTERDAVQAGLNLLVDCDYLAPITSQPDSQGGRPKITFAINPKGMK
jgi:Protein of unknown function (DUF3987)